MSLVAWLGIAFLVLTVLYTIIRFILDGNLEKSTLVLFLGGTLIGIMVLYFSYPPVNAFINNILFKIIDILTTKPF